VTGAWLLPVIFAHNLHVEKASLVAMSTVKIKEQFHYFNIQAEVDSVYGNWAVSTDGDVVNCLYPYAILAIHFKDADWMEKMKTKVWFRPECEVALSNALKRAIKLLV